MLPVVLCTRHEKYLLVVHSKLMYTHVPGADTHETCEFRKVHMC